MVRPPSSSDLSLLRGLVAGEKEVPSLTEEKVESAASCVGIQGLRFWLECVQELVNCSAQREEIRE